MKSSSNPLELLNDSNVNNLEMKRSSSNDLKDQLSKLQKKLNNNSLNKSDFSRNIEPEIHLPPVLSSKENLNNSLNNSPLTARKRNSMPIVKNVRSGKRNVDFLGDLSDGLLIESRRLTYENKQFKEKITKLTTDNDSLNKQLSNLSLVNTKISNKEEELNDKLWDLETNLGKLKSSLSSSNKDVEKLKMEKISLINSLDEFKNNFELLKIEKFQIEEENSLKIVKLNSQLTEFQIQNENLNDENDSLHKKILILEENLQDSKEKNLQLQLEQQNSTKTITNIDESFSEFDDSIVQDPAISKINESEINALDIETLKRNLKHAYSTITRLRNQSNKFKTNNNSPVSINKRNKLFTKLENTVNESNKSILPEDTWENYEEDSFAHANSSMKLPSLTKSDDESDSDNDIYLQNLSQIETSSPVNVRSSSTLLSSSNAPYCLLILPKDTLEIVDNEMSIEKLFLNFNEFQTLPMKKNDYKHLMAISENEKQLSLKIKGDKMTHSPVPITSTKYVNNNNVRLVTIQELDDLKESIREKDSQIQHWKSLVSQTSLIESSNAKTEEVLDNQNTAYSKSTSEGKDLQKMASNSTNSSMMPALSISPVIPIPVKIPTSNSAFSFENGPSLDKLLSAKDAELSIKDSEINNLQSLITNLETKLATFEPQLKNSQGKLKKRIEEKESTLFSLQSKLESAEKELKSFKRKAKENKLLSESPEQKKQLSLVALKEKELYEIKTKLELKHTEFEKIKSLYEKPSMEYIKSKSEIHNHVVIPMEEHDSMKLFLKERQEGTGKKDIELSELQNVKSELETKKIKLQELETTKDEMSKKIIALIDMQKQLDIVNGQLELKHEELADVKKAYESPSIDYIKSKSEKHGLVAVPVTRHESIRSELIIKNEEIGRMEKDLLGLKHVKSELDYHRAEVINLNSNKSEMMKKIESLENYKSNFENINKDLESKHKELEVIKSAYNSPSIEYVRSKSETHGLIAIPIKCHESLKKELEMKEKTISDLEHTKSKLEIKDIELEDLKRDRSELHQKVKEKASKLAEVNEALNLKHKELDTFKSYYESPAADYIKIKSQIHGLVAVPMTEHASMKSELKSKEEELKELQGIKAELEDKHSELESLRSAKFELDQKVKLLQLKESRLNEVDVELATKSKELEDLKLLHEEPSVDYIKSKSEIHGLVAVPMTEYVSMESELKSKQEKLKELQNIKSELDELLILKKGLTNKVGYLEKKEIQLDTATSQLEMKQKEFNDLESAYETPSVDYIKSKSAILGFTTVPAAQHISTKTQLIDSENALKQKEKELLAMERIKKDLESRIKVDSGNYASVSLKRHESVQSELEQTKEDLAKYQKDVECVKAQLDSKQKEVEDLMIMKNEISSRADKLAVLEKQLEELKETKQKLDLSHEELQQLKSERENMSKRIENLQEKEKELDKVNNKLTKIESAYETPNYEYIKSKSAVLGLVSFPKDDHDLFRDKLKKKEEEVASLQNTKKDLESAEEELQKLRLVNADMERNIELLESKDKELDDVKSQLKSKEGEIDEIRALLDSPSIDYIRSKSGAHGLVSVPMMEHESIKTLLKSREKEIEKKEMELIELRKIKKDLESSQSELEDLKTLRDEMTEKEMKLISTNSDLISKNQELSDIKTAYESPSIEYIKSKSSAFGILPVPIMEHTSMKNELVHKAQLLKENKRQAAELKQLRSGVTDKQSRLNELSVKINELQAENNKLSDIKAQYESPSEEYLKVSALSRGLVLLPFEKHKIFDSDLNSRNLEVDKLSVVKIELSKRVEELEKNEKKLNQVNKFLDARYKELECIQAKYDAPSYSYIMEKSSLLGLTAIPIQEHESIKNSLKDKSGELVRKQQELDGLQEVKRQLDMKQKKIEGSKSLQKDLSQKAIALDEKEQELNDLKYDLSMKNDELAECKKEIQFKKLAPDSSEQKKHTDIFSEREVELNKLGPEIESKHAEFSDLNQGYEPRLIDSIKPKSVVCSTAAISMNEHASVNTKLQECQAQLQQKEEDLARLNDLKGQLELKNIEVHKLTYIKDDLLKKVEEFEKRETEFLALQNGLIKKDTKKLKNKSPEMLLVSESPQKKNRINETHKVENQLEAIKTELQSKNDKLSNMKSLHENFIAGDTSTSQPSFEEQAKSKGFALIPFSEYNKNFSMQKSVSDTSTVTNISVETESAFDHAHTTVSQMRTSNPSLDYLISALNKKGFKSIPTKEYEHLMNNSSIPKLLDTTSLPNAYGKLVPSLGEYTDIAHELNIIKTQMELKKQALQILKKQSKEYKETELENVQKELQKEKKKLLQLTRRHSHSSFISNSSTSSTMSVDDVLSTKKRNVKEKENELQLRIFRLEKEKSATEVQLKNSSPSIKEKTLGLKLAKITDDLEIAVTELQSQKNVLETVDAYITSAKKMNLSPVKEPSYISNEHVVAADSALIEKKQDEVNKLQKKLIYIEKDIASVGTLDDSKLKSEIEAMNYEIKGLENKLWNQDHKMRQLVTNNDESDLSETIGKLTALGYSVSKNSNIANQKESMMSSTSLGSVGASEYYDAVSQNGPDFGFIEKYYKSDLKEIDDGPGLKATAFKLGFSLVPLGSVNANGEVDNKIDNLTFSNLQWKAHSLGYEMVKTSELEKLKERSLENSEPGELDRSQLQALADKLNLRLLSDDDVRRLKKRKVTSKELASKAAELNLVLLSEEEVSDLKLRSPLTIENLSDVAKQNSMLCIPESQFVATTICRTPDIPNVVVLPMTYYKRLLRSHDWYKSNKDKADICFSVKKNSTIQEDASFDLEPPKLFSDKSATANETSNFSLAQLANPSNLDLASLHTVNTVISSNSEMIAAITQTIIGEYLFKYYRRLGPFSSISDSRHERYFWIHPYSLTLYWSTANPVLNDPAKNNIKAVAIIGVKSVEDKNPLPPGLYHRSIIITSYDKVVKITCPTRQRHNIWLNSIRYLLEKSTENLVDDDDVEDQYNEDFSMDKKLEVERSQSQVFRHQQPRNSSLLAQNQSHKDRIASAPSRSNTLRNIVASSLRQGSSKQ